MRITRTRPKTITASRHQTKGNALWLISILCVTKTVFPIQMGGLQLSDFHCIASAQMAFNTVTVRKLFELVASQRSRACAFALLPVQVESVAWITERKNVLMGFFFLLTLLAWIAFIDERTKRPWRFYALALILYLLALSAKSTACTLPAALLLILWLQKKPINWKRVFQIVPFLVLGLGMGLVAVWWERYHQGTSLALVPLGPIERILVASHAVWFYLGKLI